MLKHIALALLFAEQLIPPPTIEDYEFGNAGHKVECKRESQPDFACALVSNFDPPVPDGIASVSGSELCESHTETCSGLPRRGRAGWS